MIVCSGKNFGGFIRALLSPSFILFRFCFPPYLECSPRSQIRKRRKLIRNWSDSRRGCAWGKALEMKEIRVHQRPEFRSRTIVEAEEKQLQVPNRALDIRLFFPFFEGNSDLIGLSFYTIMFVFFGFGSEKRKNRAKKQGSTTGNLHKDYLDRKITFGSFY
ncbi:hypothetical protein RHMOL_Rhmol13G0072800 [Rhododendron molle]|uniref:Uncharacterized protein n=1 Tax=Rhododendron molle TaxID=49168 RepID=A0ACC0L3W3_RHOML|nr:hypothetical protein RHMOL_Rhmol13G0072800 [Rhododendron molle]